MGLLSKLFGSKLESAAAELEAKAQKRATPRVQLEGLHRIRFAARGESAGLLAEARADEMPLEVANVSLSGIGFTRGSINAWPEPGTDINGVLEADGRKVDCIIKLIHSTGKVVGCKFQGELAAVQRLVLDYFRVELAGLQMMRAPQDVLKEEADGIPHWFHGKNNCELFYIVQKDNPHHLVRYQLSFFANYIEGVMGSHPKFGTVVEDELADDKPKHKGASLVSWAEAPAPDLIETIVKFLKNVPELPHSIRDELTKQIRWVREKK